MGMKHDKGEVQDISHQDYIRLLDGKPKCDIVDSEDVMYARHPEGHLLYLPNDGPPEEVDRLPCA